MQERQKNAQETIGPRIYKLCKYKMKKWKKQKNLKCTPRATNVKIRTIRREINIEYNRERETHTPLPPAQSANEQ